MIVFKKITYKNFLSTGNSPIELNLNSSHMTLFAGKNGNGKSSPLDAICFVLFGKPYRNINKPNLVNSINQKQCLVTIEFDIGKKQYQIIRGMKPNIFEIYENGKLLNQDSSSRDYQKILEQQILKFNYRAFTQVVIMGSGSYVPFMKLPIQQRREFIEDLLDIRIFSIMNILMKDRIKSNRELMRDVDHEVKLLKDRADLQKSFIEKRKQERGISIQTMENEIAEIELLNKFLQSESLTLIEEINSIQEQTSVYDDIHTKLYDLKQLHNKINKNIEKTNEEKHFYNETCVCPTCKQTIQDNNRMVIINDIDQKLNDFESGLLSLTEKIDKLNDDLSVYEDFNVLINTKNSELSDLNKKITINNALIMKTRKQIDELISDTTNIDEESKKLKEYAKSILEFSTKRKKMIEESHYHSAITALLQDTGIKSKIIKQYIPVINKLVNKYLNDLDFYVSFNLDENFNEVVKSRYRDEFVYENFSEGQKTRIDLALTFAWRDIARLKNSLNCNIIFMDELLDASMDGTGMDLAMNLIESFKNTNVFIISHRDGIQDKFKNIVTFNMKNNFSEVS